MVQKKELNTHSTSQTIYTSIVSNVQYQIKARKRTKLPDSVSSLLLLAYYHSNEQHFTSTLKHSLSSFLSKLKFSTTS